MILAILQARMSSTRLPGKVLRPLLGRPMMLRQVDRILRARRIDRLVVATSVDTSDDAVASACAAEGLSVHRGPLADVLGRFEEAAQAFGPADHVVRLTADCPLIDWRVIDECIALHLDSGADYTSNSLARSYPDGLDVEAMTRKTLAVAARQATLQAEREHVTKFIYDHPDRFHIEQLVQTGNLGGLRWTVDTPADFAFVEAVYDALFAAIPDFSQSDISDLLARRPEIAAINAPRP